jgi:hypothetical protein
MCVFIILRYGPAQLNPLKRCLGVRTLQIDEEVEWGTHEPEQAGSYGRWKKIELLSFGDVCRLLLWAWGDQRTSVDDKR